MADGYIMESRRTDWVSGPEQQEWLRRILGKADLDPAANPRQLIEADHKCFGRGVPGDADDGFAQDWTTFGRGRVYINPDWGSRPPKEDPSPCFQPIGKWVEKMADEGDRGAHVLFVGPASTETAWFHDHVARAAVFCLVRGRIAFRLAGDSEEARKASAPTKANVVALFSQSPRYAARFRKVLGPRGILVEGRRR